MCVCVCVCVCVECESASIYIQTLQGVYLCVVSVCCVCVFVSSVCVFVCASIYSDFQDVYLSASPARGGLVVCPITTPNLSLCIDTSFWASQRFPQPDGPTMMSGRHLS